MELSVATSSSGTSFDGENICEYSVVTNTLYNMRQQPKQKSRVVRLCVVLLKTSFFTAHNFVASLYVQSMVYY